jgi:hypothetical protein
MSTTVRTNDSSSRPCRRTIAACFGDATAHDEAKLSRGIPPSTQSPSSSQMPSSWGVVGSVTVIYSLSPNGWLSLFRINQGPWVLT